MDNSELLQQLTDPDEEVRAEAREELSLLMDDEVARRFLDVIASDAAEEIVADTIIGLGPIIEEAGMDFDDALGFEWEEELGPGISRETFETMIREIRAVYDDAKRPKLIRRRAFEVLIRDPQKWQAEEVRKHLRGDDPQWKMTAVFGMGHLPGFESEIATIVNSADGDILFEAIRAAGDREVTAAAKRIRELATSGSDIDLQLAAIEALPHVDPNCGDVLRKLLKSRNEDVADAAQDALDELGMMERLGGEEDEDED